MWVLPPKPSRAKTVQRSADRRCKLFALLHVGTLISQCFLIYITMACSLDQLVAAPTACIAGLYSAAGCPQADDGFDAAGALSTVLGKPQEWMGKASEK